jgi:hypothetical protein
MLRPFSNEEKRLLCLRMPALAWPALESPTLIDLHERAFTLGFGDDGIAHDLGGLRQMCRYCGVKESELFPETASTAGSN